PRVMPVEAEPKAPATQPASLFTLMTQGPVAAMLAYADKVRPLNGGELSAEIQRLGDPGDAPTAQMQLAILLSQTRVPGPSGSRAMRPPWAAMYSCTMES
ncbi:hypothetical protein ACEN8K_45975, partial [Variovorax sp. CT11-76]